MSDKILQAVISSQVAKSLKCAAIENKAQKLAYCKRNILLTKLAFWDRVYSNVIQILLEGIKDPKRKYNVNDECLKYIKNNELSNPHFAEFFFNFHEPITRAFIRKMAKELNNGMPLVKKFEYVAVELTELLNLAYVELKGMDISCEAFGGEPICPEYRKCGMPECINPGNVFFCMMNEEYKMEKGLFEKILGVAMEYLKRTAEPVLMVVDYANMIQTDYVFGPGARARYDFCMKCVKQIYFYNWHGGMTFSEHFDGLEPFLIPDKAGLRRLLKSWKEKKELIYFG